MFHICFIHSHIEGHVDPFKFLSIINRAAIKHSWEASLWYDEVPFGYIHKSWFSCIIEIDQFPFSWGRTTLISLGAVKICTLTSNDWGFPCYILTIMSLSLVLLFWAILRGVRWNFKVILICVSLMTRMLNILKSIFQIFEFPLLRILYLTLHYLYK